MVHRGGVFTETVGRAIVNVPASKLAAIETAAGLPANTFSALPGDTNPGAGRAYLRAGIATALLTGAIPTDRWHSLHGHRHDDPYLLWLHPRIVDLRLASHNLRGNAGRHRDRVINPTQLLASSYTDQKMHEITLLNDLLFRIVFGNRKRTAALIGLLNAILAPSWPVRATRASASWRFKIHCAKKTDWSSIGDPGSLSRADDLLRGWYGQSATDCGQELFQPDPLPADYTIHRPDELSTPLQRWLYFLRYATRYQDQSELPIQLCQEEGINVAYEATPPGALRPTGLLRTGSPTQIFTRPGHQLHVAKAEGKAEGKADTLRATALRMRREGLSRDLILAVTDLNPVELDKLFSED